MKSCQAEKKCFENIEGSTVHLLLILFGDLLAYACIGEGGGIAKEGESVLVCFYNLEC